MVEDVPPDGADHELGVWVLPWRPRSGRDLGGAHPFQAPTEGAAMDGIAIAEEVPGSGVLRERLEVTCPPSLDGC